MIEHTAEPVRLMRQLAETLAPRGVLLASVPNFAHWYPRVRVALGRFDYDRRGILDSGHVRFFTRRSFERAASDAGYEITRRDVIGLPFEVMERGGGSPKRTEHVLSTIDRIGVSLWPTMFGYQFLYQLRPTDAVAVIQPLER